MQCEIENALATCTHLATRASPCLASISRHRRHTHTHGHGHTKSRRTRVALQPDLIFFPPFHFYRKILTTRSSRLAHFAVRHTYWEAMRCDACGVCNGVTAIDAIPIKILALCRPNGRMKPQRHSHTHWHRHTSQRNALQCCFESDGVRVRRSDDCTDDGAACVHSKRCLFIVHSVHVTRGHVRVYKFATLASYWLKIWMKIIVKWKYTCMRAVSRTPRQIRGDAQTHRIEVVNANTRTSRWRQARARAPSTVWSECIAVLANFPAMHCAFIVNDRMVEQGRRGEREGERWCLARMPSLSHCAWQMHHEIDNFLQLTVWRFSIF